jgi:hypothetical protein
MAVARWHKWNADNADVTDFNPFLRTADFLAKNKRNIRGDLWNPPHPRSKKLKLTIL